MSNSLDERYMNMKTLYLYTENDYGEEFESEYLISEKAIIDYIKENELEMTVGYFLENEYSSDDTEEILAICLDRNYAYEIIRENEYIGSYNF